MNTSTNLADALFALLRAKDSLDAILSSPPRKVRQKRYDEACERYEQAVVDSCIEKWPAGFLRGEIDL